MPGLRQLQLSPAFGRGMPLLRIQPARLSGPALAVFPAPVPVTSIEPQAPYRIAERITG
jgi:hypothetical protein